jgi:hypothetical protein
MQFVLWKPFRIQKTFANSWDGSGGFCPREVCLDSSPLQGCNSGWIFRQAPAFPHFNPAAYNRKKTFNPEGV